MIFEKDRSRAALDFWCQEVAKLKPGQCLDVRREDLIDIASHTHNDALFTPADRILGNIMGSAYTHSYKEMPGGKGVTFIRHENTGERRHEDPDHDYRVAALDGRSALVDPEGEV